MNTFDKIYFIVKQIPKGKVASYGQIATLAGNPRLARVVGYALHVNPDPKNIPCFRVVTRDGRPSKAFVFGGENQQISLLESEGVRFINGHVDLDSFLWNPTAEEIESIKRFTLQADD